MWLLVSIVELISLLGVGILAGSSLYITLVEIPARAEIEARDKLVNWQSVFPKAMNVLKTSGLAMLPFLALAALLSFHIGWLIALLILFALGPFTAQKIAPTNEVLMALNDEATAEEIDDLIAAWGRLHNIRTVLTTVAFLCVALAVV